MSDTSRHANAGRSDFAPAGVLVWRRNWLFCPLSSRRYKWTRPATKAKIGSMRQIQNMPSTPECRNASTCGFFTRKGRCARESQNLPHTSVRRFRKCGEKSRSADQTPVLHFRDQRFCCQKSGCARRFPIFPRTSVKHGNIKRPKAKTATNSAGKQSLKRKNRLSAVPTGQAGRTVARPHHSWHFKEKSDSSQSLTGIPLRIMAGQPRVSKVTCEQKITRNFAFSQLRCKF